MNYKTNSHPVVNHNNAWKHFWPEGNGKAKPGCVLHHKDPTLKQRDPKRYYEWRSEDLVMITYKEHAKIHNSPLFKKLWSNPEYRERVVASMKMAQNKPDIKAKISNTQKERYLKGELDYLSDMMKSQWADQIKREQRIESLKKSNGTQEFRDKATKRMTGNTITKGTHWWTNGEINKMCLECPGDGWKRGQTR